MTSAALFRGLDPTSGLGRLIATLDSWGFTVADSRISVWSALVVIAVILLALLLGRLAIHLACWIIGRVTALDAGRRLLAQKLVSLAIWAATFLVAIDILGIDLTALAVFSGAFGLAVGFGLQKTFGNLLAGIILLMDRSIKPGDVIAVNDGITNTVGQVKKIGIRAVSVTTRDKKEYLIPNENLMINQVENWSYSSRDVRIQVPVGVAYTCDIVMAEKLMLQAAKDTSRVLDSPPPVVWLDSYGESAMEFIIHCWINDPEQGIGNVRSDVLKRLWALFQENGVDVPFAQRDINLKDNPQFRALLDALAERGTRPEA
ncbi:mechanosensitive ion channel family protein [Tsuneonella sp. HG249]